MPGLNIDFMPGKCSRVAEGDWGQVCDPSARTKPCSGKPCPHLGLNPERLSLGLMVWGYEADSSNSWGLVSGACLVPQYLVRGH